MAQTYGVQSNQVLAVPGLEIVIRLLPLILDGPLNIPSPSYGDYRLAWQNQNQTLTEGFTNKTIEVICQPNNPTGATQSLETIQQRILAAEARDGWIIIDESYLDASDAASALGAECSERLIVLKSFGKFYGLPGLRLGTVIANQEVLRKLERLLGQWRVSTIALKIGFDAYQDQHWYSAHKLRLAKAMTKQKATLASLDYTWVGDTNLFQCLSHPEAEHLWRHLMNSGIYTRLFNTHNLIRIGLAENKTELEKLSSALRFYGERDSCH